MSTRSEDLPRILCVDDEAHVVQSLVLHLHKQYQVTTALSGVEALKTLKRMGGAAVVISDMRMPGMDGATLLNNVMHLFPDTSRILLTGETGLDAAVAAVNKGQISHFLSKPCTPQELKAAVEAGVVKHRLANAERAVLKETLNGCVSTLMDVLALTNPLAFGRASRLKRQVLEFAATLECEDYWQLEAATLLLQIGSVSLPAALTEKIHHGRKITPEETTLAGNTPHVATALLKNVPRLEPVAQILTALTWTDEQIARLGESTLGVCTRILGIVLDYDALITRGHTVDVAIEILRGRTARFGVSLVERFGVYLATLTEGAGSPALALRDVRPGMVITEDVRTSTGILVVPRGFDVSEAFLEHARTFEPDLLNKSVRVLIHSRPEVAEE